MMLLNPNEKKEDIRDEATFFMNNPYYCRLCGQETPREEIRLGRGRLDAGKLELDLHRQYIPTKEFGVVLPLLYNVMTCNHCYYSFLIQDVKQKIHHATEAKMRQEQAKKERLDMLKGLFTSVPDFSKKRTFLISLAAHVLAIACYNQLEARDAPTLRMAILTLRCAWICRLLMGYGYEDEETLNNLKIIFYRKAGYLYNSSLQLQEVGTEDYSGLKFYGPDCDKDYGFDGLVYMASWLGFNYGDRRNPAMWVKKLRRIRSMLSKVFGFGKSSREKPSVLLSVARDTFDKVEEELKYLQEA